MGKKYAKYKTETQIRTENIIIPRRLFKISVIWGVLYGVLMLYIAFSKTFIAEFSKEFNIFAALLMSLGALVFIAPYFMFPLYLTNGYPKNKMQNTLLGAYCLLGIRFLLYALLYQYLYGVNSATVWCVAAACVAIFAFGAFCLAKQKPKHPIMLVSVALSIIPAIVVAVGICYGAYAVSFGMVGELIGAIVLSVLLLCGEVLLHTALWLFLKKYITV
ncbi:MAG: hypothetical protein IKU23_02420 [Clostridia bacterium]|nr:hypothetical protein [Clostridia bacterium]MBR5278101.1 hypothetical protein [Clostridia bacterium]